MDGNIWLKEEEDYLRIVSKVCIDLSKKYHKVYFLRKKVLTKLKMPAIIIGSFTGVASFGTTTFPKEAQRWVAIVVGVVNICIATLNTLESFFKVGEEMTSAQTTYEQLRKLAEDIEKELCLPDADRPTSGIQFLRDSYTRYQQIINSAPVLDDYLSYADKESKLTLPQGLINKIKTKMSTTSNSKSPSSPTNLSVTEDAHTSEPINTEEADINLGGIKLPSVANYLSKTVKYESQPTTSVISEISEISETSKIPSVPMPKKPAIQPDIETGTITSK